MLKKDNPDMIYLKNFENRSGYEQFAGSDAYLRHNTSTIETAGTEYDDYAKMPLTFQVIGDRTYEKGDTYTISLLYEGDEGFEKTVSYRINDGEWTEGTFGTDSIEGLIPGDLVQFKSSETGAYGDDEQHWFYNYFGCDTRFNLFGNINSLNNYSDTLAPYQYYYMFQDCTGLVSVKNLVLPSTTLADRCYSGIFYGCTSLVATPELPATTLAESCYSYMFRGCASLAATPELPATTLIDGCYFQMFRGCTSLTTAPALPATTLASICYSWMFEDCSNLTTAPALPSNILAENCCEGMFSNCTSLTTAPELPATTLASYCYQSMFQGCTGLTAIPAILPATTLVWGCYYSMFSGCTSLATAPELPATTLVDHCYSYMFQGCAGLTTAPVLPATTLAAGCYSNMFRGCTNLNSITCLATDVSATNCLLNWVSGVSSTGTFYYNPSLEWYDDVWTTGVNGIPTGWTVDKHAYFHGNGTLAMWVDDFPEDYGIDAMENIYSYDDGTFSDFLSEKYFDNVDGLEEDVNTFKYMEPFVYEGRTYYMWRSVVEQGDGEYFFFLTETNNLLELQAMSMEANINNRISPVYAVLYVDEDVEVNYVKGGNDLGHVLVMAWEENGDIFIHIDDFPKFYRETHEIIPSFSEYDGFDEYIKYYLKNPARFYGNLYEYTGEMIEYDGSEYYLWALNDIVKQKKYLLTETINPQELRALSLEANTSNRNHPAGILTEDLQAPDEGYVLDTADTVNYIIAKVFDERYDNYYRPLTFNVTSGGTITFKKGGSSAPTVTLQYKKNDEEWTSFTSSTTAKVINVVAGDRVMFKGDNAQYNNNSFNGSSARFILEGNIMSLINSENFANLTTLESAYTFTGLFQWCTGLTNTSRLVLPATTLANGCYYSMFGGCTSLTTAPELPATTLANYCYESMFYNCSSLTTAPELPATTLAEVCYYSMFSYCSSLTTAPKLPATTLVNQCYSYMFSNSTGLTTAPELPATTLAQGCYMDMFMGCTSLIQAPELPATTLAVDCYGHMFGGCTSLTAAPELPATILTEYCYKQMFINCTSLTTAPKLPATVLANSCYESMFQQCSSLTVAPELPATSLSNACYKSMFYTCSSLTTAPVLPATALTSECYEFMFRSCSKLKYVKAMFITEPTTEYTDRWVRGVASSGTFVKNSDATWDVSGVNGIPTGWTVETADE